MVKSSRERAVIAAMIGCATLFLALVYVPDIGHGFLKDDFRWVEAASRISARPWTAFVSDFTGNFYRPVIVLTFAADYALHGLRPLGYGVSNLLMLVVCALLLAGVLRHLQVSATSVVAAAALWLVNPHGINMSVLWLSGRTSLVMALLSAAAIVACLRGLAATETRPAWTAAGVLLLLGAMLSKEDALLVPVIILACLWARGVPRSRLVACAGLMLTAAAVYLALRWPSQALTAANAPDFYRLTWDPRLLAGNTFGYLDRSATVFAVALIVVLLVQRQRPVMDEARRRYLWLALIWFVAGIAITVRVPVRSSLYAVFPSMGAALAFATLFDAMRAQPRLWRGQAAVAALLGIAVCATPIYRSRNQRWVLSADVSQRTVAALGQSRGQLPQNGRIVFQDEAVRFANFSDALGEGATDAVRLFAGASFDALIVQDAAGRQEGEVARFVLEQGQVRLATAARESLPR